ncbi:MAG: hypothetical protein ACI8V5_004690, partial [Limisphaerales bacterium]
AGMFSASAVVKVVHTLDIYRSWLDIVESI